MAVVMRILVLAAVLGLATACGVRGPLELPPEAKAEAEAGASADSGQGKPAGDTAKAHRPFILDGLL